ncbi:hypothetical protein UM89_02705 [Bacillus subtilis]|nr:hypothetical protein UM89_02705 [Bacillus subtilis]
MNYKKILLLTYFNTIQAGYSYKEMCEVFGLSLNQLKDIIDELYEDEFIVLKGYYKLSEKGIDILEEHGFEDVNFLENNEESNIFVNPSLDIDDIYVPIDFTKKVK